MVKFWLSFQLINVSVAIIFHLALTQIKRFYFPHHFTWLGPHPAKQRTVAGPSHSGLGFKYPLIASVFLLFSAKFAQHFIFDSLLFVLPHFYAFCTTFSTAIQFSYLDLRVASFDKVHGWSVRMQLKTSVVNWRALGSLSLLSSAPPSSFRAISAYTRYTPALRIKYTHWWPKGLLDI